MPRAESIPCSAGSCRDVSQLDRLPVRLPADPDTVRVAIVLDPVRLGEVETGQAGPLSPAVVRAFCAAGYDVATGTDIDDLGVYVTYAVKCPKVGYGLRNDTVEACSHLLEAELDHLPNLHSIVLAGETAIRTINAIARRRYGQPAVPSGSSYKIMGHEYQLGDVRLIPSYPQRGGHAVETDGPAMIAVDLRNALESAAVTRPEGLRPDHGRRGPLTRSRDHRPSPSTPGPAPR